MEDSLFTSSVGYRGVVPKRTTDFQSEDTPKSFSIASFSITVQYSSKVYCCFRCDFFPVRHLEAGTMQSSMLTIERNSDAM